VGGGHLFEVFVSQGEGCGRFRRLECCFLTMSKNKGVFFRTGGEGLLWGGGVVLRGV